MSTDWEKRKRECREAGLLHAAGCNSRQVYYPADVNNGHIVDRAPKSYAIGRLEFAGTVTGRFTHKGDKE